ncbi:MAG: hypothetical protein ABUL44_00475, partial [Flavobacterium sp.]
APDKDSYLLKSARLQTAGWILVSTGAVLTTAGILIINNTNSGNFGNDFNNAIGGFVCYVFGIAAISTSIPLFIVSGVMKRKAAKLSFNNQRILMPVQNGFVARFQPALTLSIRL